MVRAELKKLMGNRFLLSALVVLLLLNCAIASFFARNRQDVAVSEAQKEFLNYYLAHTEEAETHAAEIEAFEAEQRRLAAEAMSLGVEIGQKPFPDVYGIDGFTDARIIEWARDTVNGSGGYKADLESVIKIAENNLAQLESDGYGDSYSANYQRKVIEKYQALLNSGWKIGIESDSGWDGFYSYTAGDLLLFAFVLLLAATLFLQEKQCGFWQLIRTARRGRLRTGIAKLTAFGIFSTAGLLLFSGSSFAVYGIVCGYSSPYNALQVLDSFRFSTLQLTVGQYLPLHLLLKWSAVTVFGLAVILLSLFFTHIAEAYAGGLLLFGVQYFLQAFPFLSADNPFRSLGLLTVAGALRLTARYRTLNCFGSALSAMTGWVILAILTALICVTATLLLYSRGHLSFDRPSVFKRLRLKGLPKHRRTGESSSCRPIKERAHSLFTWELYKRLIHDRMVPLIALILLLKCLSGVEAARSPLSYSDTIYHEYMTRYAGEWSEEKAEAIAAEGAAMDATIEKAQAMRDAAKAGLISAAEYADYLEALNDAAGRQYYFEQFKAKNHYLERKSKETEVTPSFVYDSGWNRIFTADSDLGLYIALFLLMCGIFSGDYRTNAFGGSFAPIQRTTVGGRRRSFCAKLTAALVSSALITLLFSAADFALVAVKYDLPELSASVVSLESLSALPAALSIGQYLAVYLLGKLTVALLFCLLTFTLSALFQKTLPVMSITLALTLLPKLLTEWGLSLESVDFHRYFAVTPFCLSIFQGGVEWIVLLVGTAFTVSLYLFAKRRSI